MLTLISAELSQCHAVGVGAGQGARAGRLWRAAEMAQRDLVAISMDW